MKSLIDYCAIQYDYVLLDGPPLLTTNYAYQLGEISTDTLVVIWPEKASINSTVATKQGLQSLCSNILGVIVNGVDFRLESVPQQKTLNPVKNDDSQLVNF